jgi:hypothetical protein
MWQDFQLLDRVRGRNFLNDNTFLYLRCVLMTSIFLSGAYGEIRDQVYVPPPRAWCLVFVVTLEELACSVQLVACPEEC